MKLTASSRILVVAAHPDDEVLAMGGTIAKARSLGAEVMVHFLGEGVSARFRKEDIGGVECQAANDVRMKCARDALAVLDVSRAIFTDNLCCRFDALDTLDLVKLVERTISDYDPTHIFTHNPVEVNIDHRVTYRVVETATRPKPGLSLQAVYGFEVVCSGNWTFEEQFKPNTYVDVEAFWDKKLESWRCYSGEDRPFPFPRSNVGLETLARYRGMQAGLRMAEGFKLYRETA